MPWRHVLDSEVYVADVYAEFQRACADDGFEFSGFEFVFDAYAFFFAELTMVYCDVCSVELAEFVSEHFGVLAAVDEDECGFVCVNEFG